MHLKSIFVVILASIMIMSSITFLFSSDGVVYTASNFNNYSVQDPAWVGDLTIYANGSLSTTSAPVTHEGDYYNLTGDINGSVMIERAGAIFNGNGYNVSNPVGSPTIELNQADNVTVTNTNIFSLWAAGLTIYQSSHDNISGNTVTGMVAGIFVYGLYNTISDNAINMSLTDPYFSGIPAGIAIHSSYTTVTDNTIYIPTTSDGLILDAQHSLISDNNFTVTGGNSIGIYVLDGNNLIENNIINATGSSTYGIKIQSGSQFSTVSWNKINITGNGSYAVYSVAGFDHIFLNNMSVTGSFAFGISVSASGTGSSNVSSNNVFISGSGSVGIYSNLYNSTIASNAVVVRGNSAYGIDSLALGNILNNNVSVNGTSVYGLYSSLNDRRISGNNLSVNGNSSFGMYITGGSFLIISGNIVTAAGNHDNATWLSGSDTTFSSNTITAGLTNGTALFVDKSTINSYILNNTLSYSSMGFQIGAATGILFKGNSFYNDTSLFRITGLSSNTYYHNNFVNYSTYSISASSTSIWDNGYPSGGNYWSGYVSTDLYSGPGQNISGPDGIGDTQFNISGNNIDYYPLMKQWTRPEVVFTETGLQSQTEWSVSFNGTTKYSTSENISFNIVNATYNEFDYSVPVVSGYNIESGGSGTVYYSGSDITVSIVFSQVVPPPPPPPPPPTSYKVKFLAGGLPAGTSWGVTFNGTVLKSDTTTVSFSSLNGTYDYSIGVVSGFSPAVSSGSVTINGGDITINVEFSLVTYMVTFNNVGLPSGETWYVNLSGGNSYSSTTSSVSMSLPNGTYSYTIEDATGYNVTPESGNVTVSGSSPSPVVVTFTENSTTPPPPSAPSGLAYWIYIIIGIAIGGGVTGAALVVYYRRR